MKKREFAGFCAQPSGLALIVSKTAARDQSRPELRLAGFL
jgi:hypothetical protein